MTRPTVLLLRRLRPLLDRTLDLSPDERRAFLARLAGDEPAAAREVAALLAIEPELDAAGFLSGEALDHPGDHVRPAHPWHERTPRRDRPPF